MMQYRYSYPPRKCVCRNCGYVVDMESEGYYGRHCYEISCPVCGNRMWRLE